jgi:hypothetical protein
LTPRVARRRGRGRALLAAVMLAPIAARMRAGDRLARRLT